MSTCRSEGLSASPVSQARASRRLRSECCIPRARAVISKRYRPTLADVLQRLVDNGATVVVIEHDLDIIRNADYIIDMGPGGGEDGSCIVAWGTPEEIKKAPASVTGKYI